MVTVDNISLNAEHFSAMKDKDAIEAIVQHLKDLEKANVDTPKDKVTWAKKVFGLMVKKQSPAE